MTVAAGSGLKRIEHVVVLMLENRSFDHMLGYLSLEGGSGEVDGLRAGMANHHGGRCYPIHHLASTYFPDERWDPEHTAAATDRQINDGAMDGFPASHAETLAARGVDDADPGVVMGDYNASDLPVFDHFAAEFCVCDRWHSSVAGATWPNRLYAIAGSAGTSRDDRKLPIHHEHFSFATSTRPASPGGGIRTMSPRSASLMSSTGSDIASTLPIYRSSSWCSRPVAAVCCTSMRMPRASSRTQRTVKLPAVSWIDPNFKDFNLIGSPPNDDHPPSDVTHGQELDGQELALLVYNALATGPQWDKTLLLVFYDEHGGFFDHVNPPEHPPDDNPTTFTRYGVRVPAFVISPWVKPGSVSHTLFDHATIPKTILERFCPTAFGTRSDPGDQAHRRGKSLSHHVGRRIADAADLGELLTLTRS